MDGSWDLVMDFMYLSFLLGLSAVIKRSIPGMRKLLIPNSIIAGFLAVLFGPDVLGIFNFNSDNLGFMIYHMLAIGFIAVALKKSNSKLSKTGFNTGLIITMSLTIQAIAGFAVSLFLYYLITKDVFPLMGLLLPLAFDQGPGQAFSIGSQWEALGFRSGGAIGLVMATIGFLWATIGGIFLLNIIVFFKKKSKLVSEKKFIKKSVVSTVRDYEFSDIDGMTIQLLAIGIVYLVTFGFIKWITAVLGIGGNSYGETFARVLWGLHFVVGVLFAFLFRKVYDFLRRDEKYTTQYLNDFLLQRIAGAVFDYMVAASIAAIPLKMVKENFVPILLITTIGGVLTVFYTIWFSKRTYRESVLENTLALFGMETGTISTGMALLREIDPNFESGAAENMVLGSGVALIFGIPLLVIINIPIIGIKTNNPTYFFYTLLALGVYLLAIFFTWYLSVRRK
ncbi:MULTISPECIES: sodium:glutamate symporter [Kosmotoga]|uniref:Na+/glutamate symporter-like protein n=1 Tax=Kosmotoga olearia (strain ATCC BAA-1733 / DSM 21960 / TBF 19.5.1) TaxID=521045 RepID=C5CE03_KOSOT|nr:MULTISPECIES: sodium:glutamate symporter [Kosmotoga]ACR80105.1 Na+/glutamate symporter-like protein [Kosmotoga olearia TBF 19.5.1]MDK2953506.1 glutamate:Na+ symporter, family [Kosmotoga sp.]OAA20452.1 sodium:glutamate symporter [Kosmotoga sp. DU53]